MSCGERRDRILLLFAGLLEEAEAEDLRAHLRSGCAECAGYAREALTLETDLLLSPDPVQPHPSLRDRLEEHVRGARPGPAAAANAPGAWRRVAAWCGAAAAAAALVAALATWAVLDARHREARAALEARHQEVEAARTAELEALQTERDELALELADAHDLLDEADEELVVLEERLRQARVSLRDADEKIAMLREPGLEIVSLQGTTAQPDARARVFWEWDEGYYCYLHASDLRRLEPGEVYALWLLDEDGTPVLVGTFRPESDGTATLWVKLSDDTGRATGAAVTVEPKDVGPAPSGPLHLEARETTRRS